MDLVSQESTLNVTLALVGSEISLWVINLKFQVDF